MPLILGGRYLPERLLGQGGFGAAFLAVDRYSPKKAKCVLKQFQPSGNLSPQALEKANKNPFKKVKSKTFSKNYFLSSNLFMKMVPFTGI